MMARLGDQVEEEETRIHEAEVSRKRKKTHSSGKCKLFLNYRRLLLL
jgi:hypothetical protein